MKLGNYQLLVFDCDGVILDSNTIRANAFYEAALPYGEHYARQLRAYHITHGGVSRYQKFEVFLRDMIGIEATEQRMRELLARFSASVHQGLRQCEVAPGLARLRDAPLQADWMVVAGADQKELREVFAERGMAHWFNAGIFGSPGDKDEILERELSQCVALLPGLFLGDSRYDHEAAIRAGLDFVFVSGWTDFSGWQDYCLQHGIRAVADVGEMVAPAG